MAAFDTSNEVLSGLAGEIRSATASDQYDLGGYTESRARDLMVAAFSKPLTAPTEMIKCTFVVGGGKLVRSRYDEDLTRWLIAALRDIGFTEDRSAAETFDSQGTFKQQHDTGQNLKYLIVYPRVTCSQAVESENEGSTDAFDQTSPEFICVASDLATFRDIVASKAASYAQKKRLLKILQEKHEQFQAIEAKLVSGALLDPNEQAVYDTNSGSDEEKITHLQNEIKAMVDSGHLTAREKADLQKTIDNNLTTTREELETAKAENKPKKVEKLHAKVTALSERRAAVETIAPIPPTLTYADEITKLFLKLFPIRALEDKSRSMSLTMSDLKAMEPKADLEAEIQALQEQSRGWFQDDEEFHERCAYVEAQAKIKYRERKAAESKKTGGAKTGTVGKVGTTSRVGTSNGSSWSTVAKKSGSTSGSSAGKKTGSASSFSALDGDSD
jgi:hypothetical protein